MASNVLHDQVASSLKQRPELRTGYTVRVHERIQEGEKERIQVFEGLVISVHKGLTPTDATFTVRRIASGVGVERIFPLHSSIIEKIEVKKVAKIRRAKLFFLRGRRGKAARLSERFTTSGEFAIAAKVEQAKQEADDIEVPGEEVKEEKEAKEEKPPVAADSEVTEEKVQDSKEEEKKTEE